MTLKEIANAIGIEQYPEGLDSVYVRLQNAEQPACDIALIDRLQEKYDFFGEFYELVKETAVQVNADPVRSSWVRVAADFAYHAEEEVAFTVPVPTSDGTAMNDLLPLYVILPQIPLAADTYRAKGFTEAEIVDIFKEFKSGIGIVRNQTGRPGVNKTYYWWLSIFSKAMIFNHMNLQFELYKLPDMALWLKNKQTKQIVPLMVKGTFHASGVQQLGSMGYEDPRGAFTPAFAEDEDNFYGHGVYDNVVSPKHETYPKTLWECVGRPCGACLNIHVPKGSDISRETVLAACKDAVAIAAQRYPEYPGICMVLGVSWLLNPTLKQIQGENSRITQFMECFTKYPNCDPRGLSLFNFVFGRQYENYKDLPENTSLQRKLKQLYLDGSCLHSYTGAIYIDK